MNALQHLVSQLNFGEVFAFFVPKVIRNDPIRESACGTGHFTRCTNRIQPLRIFSMNCALLESWFGARNLGGTSVMTVPY